MFFYNRFMIIFDLLTFYGFNILYYNAFVIEMQRNLSIYVLEITLQEI